MSRAWEFVVVENATGNFTGSDQVNDGFRGVLVFVNVEAVDTDNITVTVEGKSPVGTDEYYDIIESAALTTSGLTVLEIYPGIGESANESVSTVLPTTWRVTVAVGGGGTYDYDIGYVYIP